MSIFCHLQKELKLLMTHLFVQTEYREILQHAHTKWLSLQPCIERILLSWKVLTSYFQSRPTDCSKQLHRLSIDDDYPNY